MYMARKPIELCCVSLSLNFGYFAPIPLEVLGKSVKMQSTGNILGYTILREIGEGGMGKVYLAENVSIGQQVAIKILDPVLARNSELRERFNQEARIQVALQHKNIVRVLNAQTDNDYTLMILEYVEGVSLDRVIKRRKTLAVDDALRIFEQVLSAVGYAHEKGVVHRDIKPSNILVSADGTAKVTDFGIAKVLGDTKLTRTGTSMGSPDYMSPEQVLGKKDIDHRTDIYSLGATLYEMLTGRPPFISEDGESSDSDFLIKTAHVQQVPDKPSAINPLLSEDVSAVILRALSKPPEARFQTCNEFMVSLKSALSASKSSVNQGSQSTSGTGDAWVDGSVSQTKHQSDSSASTLQDTPNVQSVALIPMAMVLLFVFVGAFVIDKFESEFLSYVALGAGAGAFGVETSQAKLNGSNLYRTIYPIALLISLGTIAFLLFVLVASIAEGYWVSSVLGLLVGNFIAGPILLISLRGVPFFCASDVLRSIAYLVLGVFAWMRILETL